MWLPSLLLAAQFLTMTPVLLIVLADEQQRRLSSSYVTLLDGLDQLSFSLAGLESGETAQPDSEYRRELDGIVSNPASAAIRPTLAVVDSMAARNDPRAARAELLKAARIVRSELSKSGQSITKMTFHLKILVSGACLLLFGVVLVIRKFRTDAAIQKKLEQELRTTNHEVVTALDAVRQESATKNRILANVGQWIRMPMNVITDGADLAESLSRIADQISDYAKIELGSLGLESFVFEPTAVVNDVLEEFSVPASRKGLKLRSDLGESLPGVVKGDPGRLRQVLGTLLSNAVRFTEQGEIALRAQETTGGGGRTSLRFEVRDTGSGMTEQARNHIFQPFSQGGEARGMNEGTGLGLAISKKLVELMGGKMDVINQPGRGCTFWFTAVFESVEAVPEPQKSYKKPVPWAEFADSGSSATATVTDAAIANPKPVLKGAHERRTETRHWINYPTLLRSETAGVASVRILDVSASGLRVAAPSRLELRSAVEVRVEGISVQGVVRNCTCIRPNEFHIGIEIPEGADGGERFLRHMNLLR